jgi:hypothetical protein
MIQIYILPTPTPQDPVDRQMAIPARLFSCILQEQDLYTTHLIVS